MSLFDYDSVLLSVQGLLYSDIETGHQSDVLLLVHSGPCVSELLDGTLFYFKGTCSQRLHAVVTYCCHPLCDVNVVVSAFIIIIYHHHHQHQHNCFLLLLPSQVLINITNIMIIINIISSSSTTSSYPNHCSIQKLFYSAQL